MEMLYDHQKYRVVSHDITNHCNARCRFCFNDWPSLRPCNMSMEVFRKAREIIPLCCPQSFLFSCRFEPTIHPRFFEMLQGLPEQYGDNIYFTTNLARKLSDGELEQLYKASVNCFNVSLETYDPGLYTRLTGIENIHFYDNLRRLATIGRKLGDRTRRKLHVVTMVLRSNCDEIPDLVQRVHDEIRPGMHELRTPYISPAVPAEYLQRELLEREELDQLLDTLGRRCNYDTLRIEFGRDLDALRRERAEQAGPQDRALAGSALPSAQEQPLSDFRYYVVINADGTGRFEDIGSEFDLNQIDDPLMFFSRKLLELECEDARRFLVRPSGLCDVVTYPESCIPGELETICLRDGRFLLLHGWFLDGTGGRLQGQRVLFLSDAAMDDGILLRVQDMEQREASKQCRSPQQSMCGFLGKLDTALLDAGKDCHLFVGYRLSDKLHLRRLGILPPVGRFT